MLGALASGGVAAAMSVEAATGKAVFLAFLGRVLLPEPRRVRPAAVAVMDNLSPHKAPAVRERLEAASSELLHLPRYSPELSPIEPMWSELRALLRVAARSVAGLEAALADALDRITPGDARGFFRGCGYSRPAQ